MTNDITVTMVIKKQTEKALLIFGCFDSPNDNYGLDCWVPKSIITVNNERTEKTFPAGEVTLADITLPTWFTRKNSIMLHNPKAHYAK